MQSTAVTVDEYLQTVPEERKAVLLKLREYCLTYLPGYEEAMRYGGPTYSRNGVTEVGFGSQKHFIGLYILNKEVLDKYRSQLKDAGKGSIRYARPSDIDFDLVEKLLTETAQSSAEICS